MKSFATLFIAIVALLASAAMAAEDVRVSGSTTVLPWTELAAEEFNAQQSDYQVSVAAGGSGVGITDVGEGRSEIAMSSREIKDEEREMYETDDAKFEEFLIGYDGIVIAVSPAVYEDGVHALSKDEVKKIYAGEITNWEELGGKDSEIHAVARKPGSGTRDTFNEVIMGSKEAETPGAGSEAADSAEVKTTVAGADNAIGYVGYSFAEDGAIKAVSLDGVEPTVATIKDESYPLARKLFFYTLGTPSAGAQAFIDFVLSEQGQAIGEENGFVTL